MHGHDHFTGKIESQLFFLQSHIVFVFFQVSDNGLDYLVVFDLLRQGVIVRVKTGDEDWFCLKFAGFHVFEQFFHHFHSVLQDGVQSEKRPFVN